jgi:hypothetical protein
MSLSTSSPDDDVSPASCASPADLTATSEHQFDTYVALKKFLISHANAHGFELRWTTTGSEGSSGSHGGTVKCWCADPPPPTDAPAELSSFPSARTSASKATRQIKSDCPWRVSFFRQKNRTYRITSRDLTHNHALLSSSDITSNIDSLRKITPDISMAVRTMISNGMHGVESERRYLQDSLGVTIQRDVFQNLISKTKRELGMLDSVDDFKMLLNWLQGEIANKAAVARYHVNESVGYELDGVFYMSADMVYHLDRNGEVLVMDTTFKTNRFHWPLLLVCGVNEHWQTIVLAVGLLHHQTTALFSWALEQMASAVSPEAWGAIATVITDGDAAMSAAIDARLPHALHARCRYHLEQNLRHNLRETLGLTATEQFIVKWKSVIAEEEVDAFNTAKQAVHLNYPAAQPYLEKNHWINEQHFAECYIKKASTLGMRSTQRVEGMNHVLKGMFQVRSTTALSTLFQVLQFATCEVDRQAAKAASKRAADVPLDVYSRTFLHEMRPHLTHYASAKVQQQFDQQHHYRCEQKDIHDRDSIWFVWDTRRPASDTGDRREVQVSDAWMRCSCSFPITHLLPCRHVLALNLHLFRAAFRVGQVGKRWLRYFKPPPSAPRAIDPSSSLSDLPAIVSDDIPDPIPSHLQTFVQAGQIPARRARYGQLMGYCTTICTRGAEFKDVFFDALKRVEELARWIEANTSTTGQISVAIPPPPMMTQPTNSSSSSSADLCSSSASFGSSSSNSATVGSAMHSTVSVEQLTIPEHKKKQLGRGGEKRQASQGEKEKVAKKGRVSASQS